MIFKILPFIILVQGLSSYNDVEFPMNNIDESFNNIDKWLPLKINAMKNMTKLCDTEILSQECLRVAQQLDFYNTMLHTEYAKLRSYKEFI